MKGVDAMQITDAMAADLPAILRIERLGFSPEEAGSADQYRDRLEKLTGTFLVAKVAGQVVGFVVGPATTAAYVADWMYE
ncbi:acetyltransferase [Levilactobacillus spicheri]